MIGRSLISDIVCLSDVQKKNRMYNKKNVCLLNLALSNCECASQKNKWQPHAEVATREIDRSGDHTKKETTKERQARETEERDTKKGRQPKRDWDTCIT
jgi:hypothetical protein